MATTPDRHDTPTSGAEVPTFKQDAVEAARRIADAMPGNVAAVGLLGAVSQACAHPTLPLSNDHVITTLIELVRDLAETTRPTDAS